MKLGAIRRFWLGTAAALALTGCLTVGRDFPTDKIGQLQIGQTTRDEVHRMFGEPWRTGLEDGRRTWTYGHYRYKLFGTTETRDLVIRFDPRASSRRTRSTPRRRSTGSL